MEVVVAGAAAEGVEVPVEPAMDEAIGGAIDEAMDETVDEAIVEDPMAVGAAVEAIDTVSALVAPFPVSLLTIETSASRTELT